MIRKTLIAVSALGITAGTVLLLKNIVKGSSQKPSKVSATPESKTKPEEKIAEGKYSFISGITDPVTVDVDIRFPAERFSFSLISDAPPVYTNAPEVVVLYGDELSIQLENIDIYARGSLDAVSSELAERYDGFAPVQYGAYTCYKYIDGDCMMLVIPVSGADDCYFQAALIKEPKADFDISEIGDQQDVAGIISSLVFKVSKL